MLNVEIRGAKPTWQRTGWPKKGQYNGCEIPCAKKDLFRPVGKVIRRPTSARATCVTRRDTCPAVGGDAISPFSPPLLSFPFFLLLSLLVGGEAVKRQVKRSNLPFHLDTVPI